MQDDALAGDIRPLIREATDLRRRGNTGAALVVINDAVVQASERGAQGVLASALRMRGLLLADSGRFGPAIADLEASRTVCEANGQVAAAGTCEMDAATITAATGDVEQTRARLYAAHRLFVLANDAERLAVCDLRIAELPPPGIPRALDARRPLTGNAPVVLAPRRRFGWGRVAIAAGITLALVAGGLAIRMVTTSSSKTTGPSPASTGPGVSTTVVAPGSASNEAGIYADPAGVGKVYAGKTAGMSSFRGNATKTFYGLGPVPSKPHLLWKYPQEPMCSQSADYGISSVWCGMGWTGQVNVFTLDGKEALGFGAYDRAHHVIDATTGKDLLAKYVGGDLAKGSVTVDPDGFPLLYGGSRDNNFRVYALDSPDGKLTPLWSMNAADVAPTLWNDDWDGSSLVLGDYLIVGGENSQWYIVKLNRSYDPSGRVKVDPKVVFHSPAWDAQEFKDITANGYVAKETSIETAVSAYKHTVYFADGGGLVEGWDTTGIEKGIAPKQVFRFWTGEDTDGSIVIDKDGMLYVNSEAKAHGPRDRVVGNLMKLDPSKWTAANPDAALVWKMNADAHDGNKDGFFSTLALANNVVYAARTRGQLYAVDATSGKLLWEKDLPAPGDQSMWASPVVVDNTLLEIDCLGVMHAYNVTNPTADPPELWNVKVPTDDHCIETTPVVWNGKIFVGSRTGYLYAFGN